MNKRKHLPRRDRPVVGQYQDNAIQMQKKNGDDVVKATMSPALKEQNFEGSCQRILLTPLHENLSCACLGRNGESRNHSPFFPRAGLHNTELRRGCFCTAYCLLSQLSRECLVQPKVHQTEGDVTPGHLAHLPAESHYLLGPK